MIETLPDKAAGGDQQARIGIGECRDRIKHCLAISFWDLSMQHVEVRRAVVESFGKQLSVLDSLR